MQYTLGEYEIGQMRALLIQLEDIYPENIALQLRKLLENAISSGIITDQEIYKLLELLPLVIPSTEPEEAPVEEEDDNGNDDWPEWENAEKARRRRIHKQLQQRLAHLLFMQEAVHKKVAKKGHAIINQKVNEILS